MNDIFDGHDELCHRITVQSLEKIVQRVPAVCAKMWCLLPAPLPRSVKHRRIKFTQFTQVHQVFRPSAATRYTDAGQTLQGRRAPASGWLCKILPQSPQRCGNAAQKYQKFPLFGK